MGPTDDVQMTDDDGVGIPELATCDSSAFAGSVGTGYIDPSVIFPTEHTMSGGAFPGYAAPLVEANPNPTTGLDNTNVLMRTTEEDEEEGREAMETIAHLNTNMCTECKTRIPEPPSALQEIIRDLEHMYTETWKVLRRERHRSSRFRRLLDELRAKRLEALQQHEVSEALNEFEARYQEVRDELKIDATRALRIRKWRLRRKRAIPGSWLAWLSSRKRMRSCRASMRRRWLW
jgi:hypothetical protein